MKTVRIPQGRLHALLQEEGCEFVSSTRQLLVIRIPGWDAAFASAISRAPWLSALWDRIEITSAHDSTGELHVFRLTYFTRVNLGLHTLLCALTLFAAAASRPPGAAQLLLFLLTSSALFPAAAYYQTRRFFQKIQRWNVACNLRQDNQRRFS